MKAESPSPNYPDMCPLVLLDLQPQNLAFQPCVLNGPPPQNIFLRVSVSSECEQLFGFEQCPQTMSPEWELCVASSTFSHSMKLARDEPAVYPPAY
jgi:hypothetical protein